MIALFGWGRPLYDEDLARRFLQQAGVPDPSDATVKHYAKKLRRNTLITRTVSVLCAIWLLIMLLRTLIK